MRDYSKATFNFLKVSSLHSGPLLGTALYGIGGFGLPFCVVGALGIALAVILYVIMPPVRQKAQNVSNGGTQLTIKGVTKVSGLYHRVK